MRQIRVRKRWALALGSRPPSVSAREGDKAHSNAMPTMGMRDSATPKGKAPVNAIPSTEALVSKTPSGGDRARMVRNRRARVKAPVNAPLSRGTTGSAMPNGAALSSVPCFNP